MARAISTADRFARQLSNEELTTLHEISIGLNPRKTNIETIPEWYQRHEKNIIHFKLWNRTFRDELNVMFKMNKNYGLSKRQLQKTMADAIRKRQEELGFEDYLMNTVRISLFNTLTRMFNNPKLRQ